jgi:hypothetical protein
MLALVAPSSMTTEQQEMWLRAAVDALDDIRADEVRHVSAEVRRTVTRHNQIVPEIARLVSERRKASRPAPTAISGPPLPPPPERKPGPPLTQSEIDRMPKWMRDVGLRVGFLEMRNGKLVDVSAA